MILIAALGGVPMLDKDRIVAMIRGHFEETGEVPGLATFLRDHPEVPRTSFAGLYWSKWSDAVRDAGLVPHERGRALDESVVFGSLAAITRELSRYPTLAELRRRRKTGDLPFATSVIQRSGGTVVEQIVNLQAWCERQGAFEDVASICVAELAARTGSSAVAVDESEDHASDTRGYVYLLRSRTRGYKIGMTRSMPQRWLDHQNADPDEVELVHYFKTLDAPGIEAYWHRRFAAQRRERGEWFALSAKQAAEFKRRSKSM